MQSLFIKDTRMKISRYKPIACKTTSAKKAKAYTFECECSKIVMGKSRWRQSYVFIYMQSHFLIWLLTMGTEFQQLISFRNMISSTSQCFVSGYRMYLHKWSLFFHSMVLVFILNLLLLSSSFSVQKIYFPFFHQIL